MLSLTILTKKSKPNAFEPAFWLFYGSTTTTRKTEEGVQASAPQEMTSPVETALFQTPTMSFGEVGETAETTLEGYSSNAAGVGKFEATKVLERMALLTETTWSTSSTGILFHTDVAEALFGVARNAQVLEQFLLHRFGIEVTIRLNTNQFYYGLLMATLFPTSVTGFRLDERAVLDATTISASCGDSVIKEWKFSWPNAWLPLQKLEEGDWPVSVYLDILAPLTVANSTMPDAITVQVWARLKDVVLSYPVPDLTPGVKARVGRFKGHIGKGKENGDKAQSGVKVKFPKKKGSFHPVDSAISDSTEVVSALQTMTISDAVGAAMDLLPSIAGFLLDKPDDDKVQQPIQEEAMKDMMQSDTGDVNTNFSLRCQNYVDPSNARMPQSAGFTVSEYAQIPGLRQPALVFTATTTDPVNIFPLQAHPDNSTYKIPLDYVWLASMQWRGSIKVILQFVTSAFISARFVVQYNAFTEGGMSFVGGEYDSGLSRVINVKGDTLDSFTLPWLNSKYWDNRSSPFISISLASDIATTDTVADPVIYCLVWMAGGEDIQFAYPNAVLPTNWAAVDPTEETKRLRLQYKNEKVPESVSVGRREEPDEDRAQSSVGKLFTEKFPPIGENCEYQVERGWCTGEVLDDIASITKRYSPKFISSLATPQPGIGISPVLRDFCGRSVNLDPHNQAYSDWIAFRGTLFGTWRAAFLNCSGGMRYRYLDPTGNRHGFFPVLQTSPAFWTAVQGTFYVSNSDGWARLTIPQVSNQPFGVLSEAPSDDWNWGMGIVGDSTSTYPSSGAWEFLAARDDIQFGFPILPAAMVPPSSTNQAVSEEKGGKGVKRSSSLRQVRG
jgi:hypothetical protein